MNGTDSSMLAFFLTRTPSKGNFDCMADPTGSTSDANDIFGCGNMGYPMTTDGSCAPLTKSSSDLCNALDTNIWTCGSDRYQEANKVTKTDPDRSGGVLCCKER